ncbi:MAG: rod shape-determining protein MreC [Bacteroidales bacterium]
MNDLFQILQRLQNFVVFLLLEGICIYAILKNNDFQMARYAGSQTYFVGKLYEMKHSISSYFSLRGENNDLREENTELKLQLLALREKEVPDYYTFYNDSITIEKAKIINLSRSLAHNHFTINIGKDKGIGENQGVISGKGIVGIITNTSKHYATGITLMNEKISIPAKLSSSNNYGIIRWDASKGYAVLNEIPQHISLSVGDSIITSGFSSCFPEGLLIGKIKSFNKSFSSTNYDIEVELAEDFNKVENIYVTKLPGSDEITDLERTAKNEYDIR